MDKDVHLPRTKEMFFGEFLKKKRDIKIDGVFFCRSGVWVPPHFDKVFASMVNTVQMLTTSNIKVYENIYFRTHPTQEQCKKAIEEFEQMKKEMVAKR
jgi:hypothetical protein